jgi:hypothetical protein
MPGTLEFVFLICLPVFNNADDGGAKPRNTRDLK